MVSKWTVGSLSDSEANLRRNRDRTDTENKKKVRLRGRMWKRRGVDKGTAFLGQKHANDSTEHGLF